MGKIHIMKLVRVCMLVDGLIDCTCELPRMLEYSGHAYFCVPAWDTRAPKPSDIESAVRWACRKRAQNRPVFIHCAYGILLNL